MTSLVVSRSWCGVGSQAQRAAADGPPLIPKETLLGLVGCDRVGGWVAFVASCIKFSSVSSLLGSFVMFICGCVLS